MLQIQVLLQIRMIAQMITRGRVRALWQLSGAPESGKSRPVLGPGCCSCFSSGPPVSGSTSGHARIPTLQRQMQKQQLCQQKSERQRQRQQLGQYANMKDANVDGRIRNLPCPKMAMRRRFGNSTVSGLSREPCDAFDAYDRYRRPLSSAARRGSAIEDEIWRANARTLDKIDDALRRSLVREIQHASSGGGGVATATVPESGPTGRYRYESLRDASGRRLYVRRAVASGSDGAGPGRGNGATDGTQNEPACAPATASASGPDFEVVIALDGNDGGAELIAMSLSADESCVSYVRLDVASGNTSVVMRHIATGREAELDVDGHDVASVEWGGAIPQPSVESRRLGCDGAGANSDEGPGSGSPGHGRSRSRRSSFHPLYFVTCDELGRPDAVRAHVVDPDSLRSTSTTPILVYSNADPAVMVDVQRTKGCQYVCIQAMTKTSNEVYLSHDPRHDPILVRPRQDTVQYHVDVGRKVATVDDDHNGCTDDGHDHGDDDVYLLASLDGDGDLSVYKTTVSSLPLPLSLDAAASSSYGLVKVAGDCDDDYFVSDIDIFSTHLAVYEHSRVDGQPRIRLLSNGDDAQGGQTGQGNSAGGIANRRSTSSSTIAISNVSGGCAAQTVIPLPGSMTKCSKLSAAGNMQFDAPQLFFHVETPVTPASTFAYDFGSGRLVELTVVSAERPHDGSYRFDRVMVPSVDGTLVPMSIVYKRTDLMNEGRNEGRNEGEEVVKTAGSGSKSGADEDESGEAITSPLAVPFLGLSRLFGRMTGRSAEKVAKAQTDDRTTSHSSPSSSSSICRPAVLVGYGAYGEPVNLGFDPTWLPLIDRGFVLAFAHTRGGGELGRSWYRAGRLRGKLDAIDDFVACAEWLKRGIDVGAGGDTDGGLGIGGIVTGRPNDSILADSTADGIGGDSGHSIPTLSGVSICCTSLTARAFSAGGVLVCAARNRRPDLFDNVVLTNAFCDLYATLRDPNLFLTAHEWEEYGNPLADDGSSQLIRSYCPIVNIRNNANGTGAGACGSVRSRLFAIAALDDDKVPYWNSLILTKKLVDCGTSEDDVLLHVEERGGHDLSRAGRRIEVAAMELSFIVANSR